MERFLQSQQTVRGYTPIVNATATIDGAEVTVVGLGDGEVRPVIVKGASPRNGEIALGAVELSEHHLSIGDLVTVAPDITLRVVGIALVPVSVDDASAVLGRNALTSYDDAVRIGVFRHAAGFLVSMRSRSDIEPLIASFEQAFALPQDAFVGSAQADPITSVDYRRVRSVPLSMAVTLALLGMATLALGLAGSLRRRGADFAVLRVFGATRRQTLGAAVAQVMLLLGGVLLVAIPVGLVASRSLWLAIERRLGTVSGVSWPVLPIVLSVAVGGVMLTLAMLRPWRHVSRSNIVALLNRS